MRFGGSAIDRSHGIPTKLLADGIEVFHVGLECSRLIVPLLHAVCDVGHEAWPGEEFAMILMIETLHLEVQDEIAREESSTLHSSFLLATDDQVQSHAAEHAQIPNLFADWWILAHAHRSSIHRATEEGSKSAKDVADLVRNDLVRNDSMWRGDTLRNLVPNELDTRFLALALQAPVFRAFGAVGLAFHTRH
jgi:hypothetical protein